MPNIGRERRARWVDRELAGLAGLSSEHRRFLSVPLMEPHWHLLVEHGGSFPPSGRAAAFAIGPAGVFALIFADVPPDDVQVRRLRKHAEEVFGNVIGDRNQYVPHMIELMLLQAVATESDGRFVSVSAANMREVLTSREKVLSAKRVEYIANCVAAAHTRYELISTADAPTAEASVTDSLFEAGDLRQDERSKVLGRRFEDWMTFLDPAQLGLVHRNFNGPARFSGPAGTGKTVVALHRTAHFAKHNPGRILFTSFVKTLPAYHESGFRRLAPHAGERAQFIGLHAWMTGFLNDRHVEFHLNRAATDTAISLPWSKARPLLQEIAPFHYWSDEVHRVIKGRGITTLDEYKVIDRAGRNRISLSGAQREIVWKQLYEPYQARLEARGVDDLNDAIGKAIEELQARPLDDPFRLVVVDEVQDFTLQELRLVHQIAGGDANAPLLLVGDGQQQVYSGGWRLSDAGIPIVGRGGVLRVNYRNRAAIHDYAKRVDATNTVDDLDGGPGFVLRDTEVVLPGGEVIEVRLRRAEVDSKLVQAIHDSGFPWSGIAIITKTNKEADHFLDVLQRARIDTVSLEKWDGTYQDAVKVGTVHRAKGMDFSAVFHTVEASATPTSQLTGGERDRAELADRQTMVADSRPRDYLWVGVIVD